ncbi:MAG: vWA domain-containing protein [Pseudomonadota bacterium]
MAHRTPMSLLAITTMLATSFSAALPLQAQQNGRARPGYCRAPSLLPQLGREADNQQDQRPMRRVRGEAGHDVMSAPPPPPPPPPAPMVSAPAAEGYADAVGTSTRSESTPAATSEGRIAAPGSIMPPHPPYPYPRPRPQSGVLTAGEHDDLLNPELYARYVDSSDLAQRIPDLPRVDTSRLLTVEVRDAGGRAVPFADVVLTCSDGNSITLASQADGRAVFFPDIDRISPRATVRVRYRGVWQGAPRPVAFGQDAGGQQMSVTVGGAAQGVTKLDLMLVVDTTGSMGDEISYLQSELQSIVTSLRQRHQRLDLRVGFVFYRDEGDAYVTRTIAFDSSVGRATATLGQQSAGGGGDYPEAMDQALIRAVGQAWRPDAVKTMLLVADAPPHDERVGRTWAATEAARARRIHIVPVAASGVADEAEYTMRSMAALTQSRYLFLTDDSGVGNAHAAPAIDCYLVTRLDALLRRVIDSQLSGRRVEPQGGEVIRSVGQYDGGRCILPNDFGGEKEG